MTTNAGGPTADKQAAAAAAQATLTQSVGRTLTRESRDPAMPRWKRWLKKPHAGASR